MTTSYDPGGDTHHPAPEQPDSNNPKGHGGHGWMMIACCVPMLVVAIVLVATGVAGIGFLVVAVMCTAMMAMMMGGGGHRHT